jgi:hypothetical protein
MQYVCIKRENMKQKWIYIAILLASFVPAYTKIPMNPQDTSNLIAEVLSNPIIYQFPFLFPIAKLFLLLLFIGPIFLKNRFSKMYSFMVVILLLPVVLFQNMSNNTSYGFSVLSGNIATQIIIVILFLWEIKVSRNNFSERNISSINIITLVMGFLAFWMPSKDGFMYFNARDIILNEAGFTFCMIVPILISSLLTYSKSVNLTLLKMLSFISVYYGILNQITWFILNPVYWWMGVVHFPLLVNGVIGFIISIKEEKCMRSKKTSA